MKYSDISTSTFYFSITINDILPIFIKYRYMAETILGKKWINFFFKIRIL